jgi:hypothetical protein
MALGPFPIKLARFALCLSAVAMNGCMTAKVEELRQGPTHILNSEAVVVLAKPHLEGVGTEADFLNCLEKKLVGAEVSAQSHRDVRAGKQSTSRSALAHSAFQLYADTQFIDALYPWLEPSTAPANADGLSALLARPGVSERVAQMGVRYIVWVDGSTRKIDSGGSIACAAGPGGAGCLGLGWWEKNSEYEATVWDLRNGTAVGTVSTGVRGTSILIGAIAPIPIITPVQSAACGRLAAQLKSFLADEEPGGDGS